MFRNEDLVICKLNARKIRRLSWWLAIIALIVNIVFVSFCLYIQDQITNGKIILDEVNNRVIIYDSKVAGFIQWFSIALKASSAVQIVVGIWTIVWILINVFSTYHNCNDGLTKKFKPLLTTTLILFLALIYGSSAICQLIYSLKFDYQSISISELPIEPNRLFISSIVVFVTPIVLLIVSMFNVKFVKDSVIERTTKEIIEKHKKDEEKSASPQIKKTKNKTKKTKTNKK